MLKLRRAVAGSEEDLKTYLVLQEAAWGDDHVVSYERARCRFARCANMILFVERDGEVIGTTTMIRLTDYDFDRPLSWYEATGDGSCATHDPNGSICFGVDLSAPEHMDVVNLLMAGNMQLIIESGVKYGILGGRLRSFSKYINAHPKLDRGSLQVAEDYLWTKRPNGKYRDPHVQMYSGTPGLKLMGLIPDYFDDPESLDYGVLWRWRNPFYGLPLKSIGKYLPIPAYHAESWYNMLRRFDWSTLLLK